MGRSGTPGIAAQCVFSDWSKTIYLADSNRTWTLAGNTTDADGRPVVDFCDSSPGDASIMYGQWGDMGTAEPFDILFSNNRSVDQPRSTCVGEDGTAFPIRVADTKVGATTMRVYQEDLSEFEDSPTPGMGPPYIVVQVIAGSEGQQQQQQLIPVHAMFSLNMTTGTSEGVLKQEYQQLQVLYRDWTQGAEIDQSEWALPKICSSSSSSSSQ